MTHTVRRPRFAYGRWIAGGVASVVLGILLFWAVVLPRLFTYCPVAVVNAEVASASAPIAGEVKEIFIAPGDPVLRGTPIASLHNSRLDTTILDQLVAKHARTGQALADDLRQRDALRTTITQMEAGHALWRSERAAVMTQELDRARADRDLAALALAETEAAIVAQRQSEADVTEALLNAEQAKVRLSHANDRILSAQTAAEALLAGARDGEFPGHAALQQARRDLATAIAAITAHEANITATDEALRLERERLDGLRIARVASDDDGLLLRLQVSTGRWVRSGDVIAQIARPETTIIEAILPERSTRATIGAEVLVSLVGQNRTARGRITAILAPGHEAAGGTWADDFAVRNRYRTIIQVSVEDDARNLQLNQAARLIILGENPGTVRQWLAAWHAVGKF